MKTNVHIERLILEGLPVSIHEGPRVQAAMTAELARLIGAHGISDDLRHGAAVPAVRARGMRTAVRTTSRQLGTEIARMVYESIANLPK
jgi:2-hydroxychromene-2-carboxylate isomerase